MTEADKRDRIIGTAYKLILDEAANHLDKRDRIIEAAYKVLSESGYDRTSMKEIAKAAGVAQGLINYYFASKDLLLAEVFRRQTIRYCASFAASMPAVTEPLTTETIARLLQEARQKSLEDPDWLRLRFELFAIGLRNGGTAQETLREMLAAERRHISGYIADITGLSQAFAETFAAIYFALFEGLGLQKVADPDWSDEAAYAMLAEMLGAYYLRLTGR